MRYLSAADLDLALPMASCIEAMRAVYKDSANAVPAERLFVPQPRATDTPDALLGVMPAGWAGHGFGAKIVSIVPDNPQHGRPGIQGVAVLLDAETGTPRLITDAARLTTRRTAAMAGLATDHLACPEARRLAVIGAGALAADMIAAMRAVRPIETVKLHSRTRAKAESLADDLDLPAAVTATADDAVADADVIVLCTTSPEPVVNDAALPPGTHVCAVGNFSAEGSELELVTVARAAIWVDTFEGALTEAGELIQAAARGLIPAGVDAIRGDLATLANASGLLREAEYDLTLYKSVGDALADVGAMVWAERAAEADELGTLLN